MNSTTLLIPTTTSSGSFLTKNENYGMNNGWTTFTCPAYKSFSEAPNLKIGDTIYYKIGYKKFTTSTSTSAYVQDQSPKLYYKLISDSAISGLMMSNIAVFALILTNF